MAKNKGGIGRALEWFSRRATAWTGGSWAFIIALGVIVVWAVTGPLFGFSDTWQLVINTGTTIVTFLMVFLIQNTQNRDTEALQVKLDELIRVTEGAHLVLLDLEELDDKQLDKVRATYEKLATKARADLKLGKDDTGVPDLGDEDEDEAFLEEKGSKATGKKKKK